jgi:uncharacterized membrane protein YkgB
MPARRRHAVAQPAVNPPATAANNSQERAMSIGTIVLIVLILVLVGVLPTWPHAKSWGYGPSGIIGVVLVILLVLVLMGRI